MKSQCTKKFATLFTCLYETEDILAFIIRGHLYCEAALEDLLRNSLKNPKELNFNRLEYSKKLDFCSAIGVLPLDLKPGLKQLGNLRNKIVHNLEYDITEKDQMDLMNSIRSNIGEPAEYFFSRRCEFPNGLRRCILSLWIPLQFFNSKDGDKSEDIMIQIAASAMTMSGLKPEEFLEECKSNLEGFYSNKK